MTLIAFVLLGAGFVTTADQFHIVVRKENYIIDITYKYNKDGTIRHDEDGNKELKTSWGQRTVQGHGMNPTPLFFVLGCYACLIYNLRGTGKTAAEAKAQREAAAAKTKTGTKTTAKTGTKTRAKAPAKSKLPSAGEQEKARRAAMKQAQEQEKDEKDER